MKILALAAATVGLAVTATPAFAGSTDKQSIDVSFADLNLSTPEGQETLDKRIKTAARKACGLDQVRTGTRIKSSSATNCYNNAMTSVKRQVAAAVADQQRGG
ncbi:MAG: UrcA family protein [Pseudomonadota bacterium]